MHLARVYQINHMDVCNVQQVGHRRFTHPTRTDGVDTGRHGVEFVSGVVECGQVDILS
jgi:hypothetical protein